MSGSGSYTFSVTSGSAAVYLRFVDKDWSISGGDSGNVLLDINDGVIYCFDEIEFPPPPPRIEWRDPAHFDGREVSFNKYENREITIQMHVFGTDVDDLSQNIRNLWEQCLADNPILEWQPEGWTEPVYADLISPPISIDPAGWFESWVRDYKTLKVLANLTLVFEAKSFLRGPREYVTILENIAPNPSFEEWTSSGSPLTDSIDDWTITLGGASQVNQEAGTIFDGTYSVEMIRSGGDCYLETTLPITINPLNPYYLDAFVYSTAVLGVTIEVFCFDDVGAPTGSVAFTGNTRGGTEWDKEVIYLYQAGAADYYIKVSDWPVDTDNVKIRISLNSNGTVYVDKLWFGSVEYVSDHAASGVIGISVADDEIKGDVPAFADFYFSNPYTSPPWKMMASEVTDDLNDVDALDATHVRAVGEGGTIDFFDGSTWAEEVSGTAEDLNGVSVFDSTNSWAVGDNGEIRFFGAPWTDQTYPVSTPAVTDMGMDNWTGVYNLTNWTETLTSGYLIGNTWEGWFRPTFSTPTGWLDVIITSDKTAIDHSASYTITVWQDSDIWDERGTVQLCMSVLFYDAGGVYLGSKDAWYPPWFDITRGIDIGPADYPDKTTQIALQPRVLGAPSSHFRLILDAWAITQTAGPDLHGTHAISANNAVAVGESGCVISTADGGTTWVRRDSKVWENLNSVHYVAGLWYVVGDNGTIITSPDMTTWTVRTSGTTKDLYGVYALDATHIYAVGEDGAILFSANAGVTWTDQTVGTTNNLLSVYAADATHIWAVGEDGAVWFSNGVNWTIQTSTTSENLNGVSGLSATSVWMVGDLGTILYGVYATGALEITDLILGQRKGYSTTFNPVQECTTGTLDYDPYRRWSTYRIMDAAEENDFLFNLAGQADERYMPTAGLTLSGPEVTYDQGHIHKLLQLSDGTDITTQYQTDEAELVDPDTDWKEIALVTDRWQNVNIPTHVVSDDAILGNINQVLRLIVDASLDGSPQNYMWVDYAAVIPVYIFVRVDSIVSNYLILDSTMGYVLDSIDGGPSTAQAHLPSEVIGVPNFLADPDGMNLTLIAIEDDSGNHKVGSVNIEMTYDPLFILVSEG